MKKLKVLFLTAEYSDHSCGGAGVYAYELTKAFSKMNIAVHVIVPGKKRSKERVNRNLTVESLPTIFLPILRTPIYLLAIRKYINEIASKENISIINGNHTVTAWVKTNIPMLTTLHHPAQAENENFQLFSRILNQLDVVNEKLLVKKSQAIITTSSQSGKLFLALYPKQKKKFTTIPIGIDTNFFKPDPNARKKILNKYSLYENTFLVFVPGGARARRKGLQYLLKAIDQFDDPSVKFIISGSSREIGWSKSLSKLITETNNIDQIIFTGELEYSELSHYYCAANLVIFPSIFEGYGLPTLEALSCGTPVIATNTGEAENIILNDRNGILIEPRNSEQILQAMKKIIGNRAFYDLVKKNARKSVIYRYDWSTVYKSYIREYEKFLS